MAGRAGGRGHGAGGAPPSHLADGQQDHGGQRHAGQQGARADRGPPSCSASPYDALEVVVHPQSIVHAFVEFCDGSVIAQLGVSLDGAADSVRADPSGTAAGRAAFAGSIRWRPDRSPSSRCAPTSSAPSRPGWRPAAPAAPRRRCSTRANEVAVAAFLAGDDLLRPDRRGDRAGARRAPRRARRDDLDAVREADRWARARARERVG